MSIFFLGCATIYTHPTKNAQDFERDKYECELIAKQTVGDMGYGHNPLIEAGEIKRCLKFKYGWTPIKK